MSQYNINVEYWSNVSQETNVGLLWSSSKLYRVNVLIKSSPFYSFDFMQIVTVVHGLAGYQD